MKQTINKYEFSDAFVKMNRENNFSYEGRDALFNFLEEYEEATGEEMELDIIALCCDFTEYADIEEFQRDYGEEYETIEDIEQRTIVIPIDDESFIIQCF